MEIVPLTRAQQSTRPYRRIAPDAERAGAAAAFLNLTRIHRPLPARRRIRAARSDESIAD
jgi:hypothetical protein